MNIVQLTPEQKKVIRRSCRQLAEQTTAEDRRQIIATIPPWDIDDGQIIPETKTAVYQLFLMVAEDYFTLNADMNDWANHPKWLTGGETATDYTLNDFLYEMLLYPYFF